MAPRCRYYVVHAGYKPGIYDDWPTCQAAVKRFKGGKHQGFNDKKEAEFYLRTGIAYGKFYGVARGLQPGVYDSWNCAEEQISGVSNSKCSSFDTKSKAEHFVRTHGTGFEGNPVPFFPAVSFAKFQDFQQDDTKTFMEEFHRLATQEGWSRGTQEYKQQKFELIKGELEKHFFASFQWDDGRQASEWEIKLRGFQNLCKRISPDAVDSQGLPETIDGCRRFLKGLYVNIIDFIDAARTGNPVYVFPNYGSFQDYTSLNRDKTIPIDLAKQDEILSALLHRLDGKEFDTYIPRRHKPSRQPLQPAAANPRATPRVHVSQYADVPGPSHAQYANDPATPYTDSSASKKRKAVDRDEPTANHFAMYLNKKRRSDVKSGVTDEQGPEWTVQILQELRRSPPITPPYSD